MRPFYKTIASAAQAELVERKSRFIATVRPVTQEDEALALIEQMRKRYYDASHNVYAYIIGENNICRYSDDGEPSGTAGVPVLEVLKKEELIDVAVVVTRYFGGTLLGSGGLIRAYGSAAKLGVDAGKVIVRQLCDIVSVRVDYQQFGKVKYEALAAGYIIDDIRYEGDVTLLLCCRTGHSQELADLMVDVTGARVLCHVEGQKYIDLEGGDKV